MLILCFALLFGTWINTAVINANEAEAEGPPPQNLRVVEGTITHNSAEIEWDLIGDDEHPNDIQVFHADDDKYITWGHRWNKVIGGLQPDTTYRIYITWDSQKEKSNAIEFTTLPDTSEYKEAPLPAPLNFQVTSVTASTVSFKWIGSPDANGYDIYVNEAWISGVWDGSNQYTYTLTEEQAVAGTELTFQVAAQLAAEGQPTIVSAGSNKISIKWGELAVPQDVQATTVNRTTAVLGWAPVAGATSYNIYQDDVLIGSSTENRFTATGLNEGTSYSYTVEAINPLWTSEVSDAVVVVPGASYTNVTYYASWSVYDRQFYPNDVDVSKITHINYAFADLCWKKYGTGTTACQSEDIPLQNRYVHDGEIVLGDQVKDIENFNAFTNLKSVNPEYKLLVSVGGWSWSKHFSNMAANEVTRRTFAQSAVDFIREYKLDGLDIDWEYPVEGGETHNYHSPEDNLNFTLLMQTVRAALDAAGSEDHKYYLLTIASGQGDNFVVNADLANSSKYLDFINIMTYDYGGSWETLANHNAPLYYDANLLKPNSARNHVLGGVEGHLAGGVPEHKLVLGLPFYGKAWSGCEAPGQYVECTSFPDGSWEKGIYDYSDIITFIGTNGYERYWNDAAKVAYLYSPEQRTFMTYNDQTSMMYSASLVKSKNLAGVMSWEVSGDRTGELLSQLNKDLPINGVVNDDALAAPEGLALTMASYNALTISWDHVDGATGYEAYIDGRYAGYTEKTNFTFEQLSAVSDYDLHVLAVQKADEHITAVSASSNVLNARTVAMNSGGSVVIPPSSQRELSNTNVKNEDQWIVSVDKGGAVAVIKGSSSSSFTLTIDPAAPSVEVRLPKEVTAALTAVGAEAELIITWSDVTYHIPAHVLDQGADTRILLKEQGKQSVGSVLQPGISAQSGAIALTVEAMSEDGKYEAINQLKGTTIDVVLPAGSVEETKVRGIVYLPESNTFRSVVTTAVKQADGSIQVKLEAPAGGTYMVVKSSYNFKDTELLWANDAINRASNRLIVFGESEEHFGASTQISRAQFVSIVVRGLELLPQDDVKLTFEDVEHQSQYVEDIAIAFALGLVNGKQPGKFDPEGAISRQEMAVVLHRAMVLTQDVSSQVEVDVLNHFNDQELFSAYAKDAIGYVFSQNIMKGVSASRFDPYGTVTKAQAVVAIMRLLDHIES